jgi:hypothetical protein
MEDALSTSDYCLLVWSTAAAGRDWVREEWQAALHRSVEEARAFLVVGRLDRQPMPALLKPRLYVELHPEIEPGLSTLVQMWRDDRSVETESERPVASARDLSPKPENGVPVYLTSEILGITCVLHADLDLPAAVFLSEVQREMDLPQSIDYKGRVGMRFRYHLLHDDRRLDLARSLTEQDVRPKSLLWLETTIQPFAATDSTTTSLSGGTFRGAEIDADDRRAAASYLLSHVEQRGLGARRRSQAGKESNAS